MIMHVVMAKVVVGKTADIQEGKLEHITAGGKEIMVTKLDGNYYAIDNICITQGRNFMKVN